MTPGEDWGEGSVTLVEIPADREIYDNIVAYWRPRTPLAAGTEHQFTYRLTWCEEPPIDPTLPRVVNTRMGKRFYGGRLVTIDFSNADILPKDLDELSVHVSSNRGKVTKGLLQRNPDTGGVRLAFTFPRQRDQVDGAACAIDDGRQTGLRSLALQVDSMSAHDPKLYAPMPAATPLPMPIQDLSRTFKDPGCKKHSATTLAANQPVSLGDIITGAGNNTGTCCHSGRLVPSGAGSLPTELAMMVLVGFSAFWIALSVASSTIGLFFGRISAPAPQADPDHSLDIALLVPVYNEDAGAVFSRVQAMRDDLAASSSHHRLAVFLLSDTRDETIAGQEQGLFCGDPLLVQQPVPLYYRRRAFNTERKNRQYPGLDRKLGRFLGRVCYS